MVELHLKLTLDNGVEKHQHSFMKSVVSKSEIKSAFELLKQNFKSKDNLVINLGF